MADIRTKHSAYCILNLRMMTTLGCVIIDRKRHRGAVVVSPGDVKDNP